MSRRRRQPVTPGARPGRSRGEAADAGFLIAIDVFEVPGLFAAFGLPPSPDV
ncbi:hypothetical protein [Microtetraspora niveoalba]|uniref:hypothetical protein n=1 Tax=Microtetraspora niveoalba TaxID=46175 RepID=UPI0012F9E68B|nr:hypothetical protein [Microtetraspora niveoalba]